MADDWARPVGSLVTVTSPQGELTPFGIVPKYKRFKVAGIFTSGFYDYDNTWAFIRLSDAQRLFDLGDVVSVLEFKVDDIYQAAEIGQELEAAAGKGFMSTNWMEQNTRSLPRLAPGARGDLYHHRADRVCGRAEHPDLADHDGDGEDARHRRAGLDGRQEAADAAHLHLSGAADRGDRDGARA